MDRETARQYIKEHLEDYLQSRGINTSRPFKCLNPDHADNKPSMSIDRSSSSGIHCKCFSCGAYYDTFDLIRIDYRLTEDKEVFKKAYELFNITVDSYNNTAPAPRGFKIEYQNQAKIEQNTHSTIHNSNYTIEDIQDTETIDFTNQVEAAHKELLETPKALQYLQSRGLSMETIKAYNLGYDAGGYNHFLQAYPDNQTKSKKAELYRYIFPYPNSEGRYNYFLTEIEDRKQVDDYNGKYRKITKGQSKIAAQIFNERYLQSPPPVIFLCEGIYDALSVEETGEKAIAFVGTAHRRFLSLCKKYMPDTTFIISLDNDEAGQKAIEAVKEGLDFLKIPYMIKTAENGKDFNEALQMDRGAFTEYIQQIVADAEQEKRAKEEAEKQEYLKSSTAYQLQSFIDNIEKSKTASFYPTGYSNIDKILDGGLYAGLYVIGAISSLGKTTFCLNILDNIAAAGYDVIIFSLEMARGELIAKSVSRHSVIEDLKTHQTTTHAKTVRGITTGSRYKNYSPKERAIIEKAITSYSEYAEHIYIHEGIGNIGVEEVRQVVDKHIKITGNKPVILIDYIQILAPYNDRATDKQNTDKSVLELKRISRDYSIPVIGISSFNRDNYTQPVNMAAFKESGAVEYSSDVLIALQYEGMDYKEKEKDGERQKRIRALLEQQVVIAKSGKAQSIQVKILKNRNGSKGSALIDFYPMFNLFAEKGKSGIAKPEEEGGEDTGEWEPITIGKLDEYQEI